MSTGQLTLHRPRLRVLRRQGNRAVSRGLQHTAAAARRAPFPEVLRRALSAALLWRPGTRQVRVSRILLGGQNGQDAAATVAATGDLLWPSRPVAEGPHAELIDLGRGRTLTDDEILASSYAALARACIRSTGEYFSATDDAGIVELARDFLQRASGSPADPPPDAPVRPHQSAPGSPVLLAPIRGSDCYQVIDGHHRVALAADRGAFCVDARIRRLPVTTPVQDLLEQMSWIGGERELYQPVHLPELASGWTVVRRCTDRLALMAPYLDEVRADVRGAARAPTYLDVASCYGWFVDRVGVSGFRAEGIERDPLAPTLGAAVYGLDPAQVHTGDAPGFLADSGRTWDVVSCFSLLHHFVLGRGTTSAEELMRRLDRATGRVLFLDTGQGHEAWFRDSLPDWDPARVAAFLTEHGTFDRVIDLGPDQDAVAPYRDNYGRHLFACVRDR